jgi:sec-independent protein translocase protein TatA
MALHFLAFLGWGEIVLILAVVLILFGAKKLPELAKGLGTGIKEFKKASREITDDFQRTIEEEPPPAPRKVVSSETPVTPPEGSPKQD